MLTCTFFGHRDAPETLAPQLERVLTELIEKKNVTRFYVGNNGNFDSLVRRTLEKLSAHYPIAYDVVLSHVPKSNASYAAHTVLPEGIETVLPRFAVVWRNKWMIRNSDVVVCYVKYSFGGAASFRSLAEKEGKMLIDLI